MSCVHYKFSSKLNYDTVTFDGLHISLCDLKKQIMGREKLKAADCDLQITNAQTKEGKRHRGSRYLPVEERDTGRARAWQEPNRHFVSCGPVHSGNSWYNFGGDPRVAAVGPGVSWLVGFLRTWDHG